MLSLLYIIFSKNIYALIFFIWVSRHNFYWFHNRYFSTEWSRPCSLEEWTTCSVTCPMWLIVTLLMSHQSLLKITIIQPWIIMTLSTVSVQNDFNPCKKMSPHVENLRQFYILPWHRVSNLSHARTSNQWRYLLVWMVCHFWLTVTVVLLSRLNKKYMRTIVCVCQFINTGFVHWLRIAKHLNFAT